MFFERKRNALKYAALGITLASVPVLNFGVVMAAAMADDAGRFNAFERDLQNTVLFSAMFWVPAVVLLPFALAYLVMNTVIDFFACAANMLCDDSHKADAPAF